MSKRNVKSRPKRRSGERETRPRREGRSSSSSLASHKDEVASREALESLTRPRLILVPTGTSTSKTRVSNTTRKEARYRRFCGKWNCRPINACSCRRSSQKRAALWVAAVGRKLENGHFFVEHMPVLHTQLLPAGHQVFTFYLGANTLGRS